MAETLEDTVRSREGNSDQDIVMAGLEDIAITIDKISGSTCALLLLGETGTGKEMLARRIHARSDRRNGPFVAVNIGGVDDNLLTSELFGHTKGAFTDARQAREGYFATAERGTILLDEIGELTAASQVKLLRVLQEGRYHPIGSSVSKNTNARVIAATNVDIPSALRDRRLRPDLIHRFKMRITIPPLRERTPDAVQKLSSAFTAKYGKGEKKLSAAAVDWICSADRYWPGNVRQLESVIEMACLLAPSIEITPEDLKSVYYDDLNVDEKNNTKAHLCGNNPLANDWSTVKSDSANEPRFSSGPKSSRISANGIEKGEHETAHPPQFQIKNTRPWNNDYKGLVGERIEIIPEGTPEYQHVTNTMELGEKEIPIRLSLKKGTASLTKVHRGALETYRKIKRSSFS